MAYYKKENDYQKTDDPREQDKLMFEGYQVISQKKYERGVVCKERE